MSDKKERFFKMRLGEQDHRDIALAKEHTGMSKAEIYRTLASAYAESIRVAKKSKADES